MAAFMGSNTNLFNAYIISSATRDVSLHPNSDLQGDVLWPGDSWGCI